jgi:hypothetical protein
MSDDYVECWFIGGPWRNSLRLISRSLFYGLCPSIRVPVPNQQPYIAHIPFQEVGWETLEVPTVEYTFCRPLETGVPVFSCLSRIETGGGCSFGLKSVM